MSVAFAPVPNHRELVAEVEETYTALYQRTLRKQMLFGTPYRKRPTIKPSTRRNKVKFLAQRDGAQCTYCGGKFQDLAEATLDHIIPVSMLRGWNIANLALACETCNFIKGSTIPPQLVPMLAATLTALVNVEQRGRRLAEPDQAGDAR